MLKSALIFFAACLVFLFVFVWSENEFAHSFQSCVAKTRSQETTEHPDKQSYAVAVIVRAQLDCSFRFIDQHNGFFAALAAMAVAAFTFTLWISTSKQARLTGDSIKLARQEFVATHRPHIIVYGFDDQGDGEKPHRVQFRYVNKGNTRAYVTEIGSALIASNKTIMESDFTDYKVKKFEPPVEVKSGNSGFKLTEDFIDYIKLLFADRDGAVFCVGYVIYRDDNGTSRQTGFCRRYEPNSGRWLKVEDEEYEYSY
jgi:hypothetical protein